jgi:hypothetical protein
MKRFRLPALLFAMLMMLTTFVGCAQEPVAPAPAVTAAPESAKPAEPAVTPEPRRSRHDQFRDGGLTPNDGVSSRT